MSSNFLLTQYYVVIETNEITTFPKQYSNNSFQHYFSATDVLILKESPPPRRLDVSIPVT